jgi:hypothetical protein
MYIPMNKIDDRLENGDCGLPTLNQWTRALVKPSSLLDHVATIRLVESTFPDSSLLESGFLGIQYLHSKAFSNLVPS